MLEGTVQRNELGEKWNQSIGLALTLNCRHTFMIFKGEVTLLILKKTVPAT
jgi:hypothetical protein